ncbi:MAG: NACHT domain-containing protein [Dokdonella sp.]
MTQGNDARDRRTRSGGKAGAGGFNFQAHATATLYVSILSGRAFAAGLTPANWPPLHPKDVSVETGSGGDDIRVVLADGGYLEAQARRRAKAGKKLFEAIEKISGSLQANPDWRGALICSNSSSAPIRDQLREDIERIAGGRQDDLHDVTKRLLRHLSRKGLDLTSFAARFSIIVLTEAHPPELNALVSEQTPALWKVLVNDAHRQIELRGRRSLQQLVEVVTANGFEPQVLFSDSAARALASYTNWLAEKTSKFRIPGCDTRIPVDRCINLKIVFETSDAATEQTKVEPEGVVERYYATSGKRRDAHNSDAHFAIDFNRRVVLIGGPGSGKSLILRRIAHRLALRAAPLLFFQLRDLVRLVNDGGRTFSEALAHLAFDGFQDTFSMRHQLLGAARYLIADGLDECGEFASKTAAWLNDWLLAHPQVQALITTRPVGFDRHWLSEPAWHHAIIQPLDEYDVDRHLVSLASAMGISLAGDSPLRTARVGKRSEEREKSRWASPLTIALTVSLIAQRIPIPDHEADLLGRFIDCYRSHSATGRDSPVSIAAPILDRILESIAAQLRTKPSIEARELLKRVAADIAPALGKPSLAACDDVKQTLDFWEQRGLLERLHVGQASYYAFAHMQLCEVVAASYWAEERTHSPARFAEWVTSSISDAQQWEVVRLVARNAGASGLFDVLIGKHARGASHADDLICRVGELVVYAGAERSDEFGVQRQHAIEELFLSTIRAGVRVSSKCADLWMDLPWTRRTDSRKTEAQLLGSSDELAKLCGVALKLHRSPESLADSEIIGVLRSDGQSGITVTSSGGLCIQASPPGWTLRNKVLVQLFKGLTPDSPALVLDAAQWAVGRQNYSSNAATDLLAYAAAAGLDVSTVVENRSWKNFFTDEDRLLDQLQDVWFLDVLTELAVLSADVRSRTATCAAEFRDVGAIWSALGVDHTYLDEFLDLSDPPDSVGLRSVLGGICDVLGIDRTRVLDEIRLIRPRLDAAPLRYLGSLLPKVPLIDFVPLSDAKGRKFLPAEGIVDGLFHASRAVTYASARLIDDGNCNENLASLVDVRLQDAPTESMKCVSLLAEHIWGANSIERLREELDKDARPGLSYFAERLVKEPDALSDSSLYEQILRLAEQDDVHEAARLAALLPPFAPSLRDRAKLRRLLDYWSTHHPAFRNGEPSYISPVVPLVKILRAMNVLTEDDRLRLQQIDRSDVRESLK